MKIKGTIDPTDIGRVYEPILINSQSGKGGVSYIMEHKYGYIIPKKMLVGFSKLITDMSDEKQTVLTNHEIHQAFKDTYVGIETPIKLVSYHCDIHSGVTGLCATIEYHDKAIAIDATGNGPLEALRNGLHNKLGIDFEIVEYSEHALERSSASRAATYIAVKASDSEENYWGVGVDNSINTASMYAVISAINKYLQAKGE